MALATGVIRWIIRFLPSTDLYRYVRSKLITNLVRTSKVNCKIVGFLLKIGLASVE